MHFNNMYDAAINNHLCFVLNLLISYTVNDTLSTIHVRAQGIDVYS
jgi:hypothetical protein